MTSIIICRAATDESMTLCLGLSLQQAQHQLQPVGALKSIIIEFIKSCCYGIWYPAAEPESCLFDVWQMHTLCRLQQVCLQRRWHLSCKMNTRQHQNHTSVNLHGFHSQVLHSSFLSDSLISLLPSRNDIVRFVTPRTVASTPLHATDLLVISVS